MNMNTLNKAFDPQKLADDLFEVRRIYARFFATLDEASWDKPVWMQPARNSRVLPNADLTTKSPDGVDQRSPETTQRSVFVPAHEHPVQRGCQAVSCR